MFTKSHTVRQKDKSITIAINKRAEMLSYFLKFILTYAHKMRIIICIRRK